MCVYMLLIRGSSRRLTLRLWNPQVTGKTLVGSSSASESPSAPFDHWRPLIYIYIYIGWTAIVWYLPRIQSSLFSNRCDVVDSTLERFAIPSLLIHWRTTNWLYITPVTISRAVTGVIFFWIFGPVEMCISRWIFIAYIRRLDANWAHVPD